MIDTNDYGLYEDDAEKTLERRHQNLNQKRALCEKRSKKDKRTVERIKRDLVYCIYSLMTDGQTDGRLNRRTPIAWQAVYRHLILRCACAHTHSLNAFFRALLQQSGVALSQTPVTEAWLATSSSITILVNIR